MNPWGGGIIVGVVFSIIFLWPMYVHLGLIPGRDHLDYFLVLTMVQHWIDVITGHAPKIAELSSMYGIPNTVFFTDHHLLQVFEALPIYFMSRNIVLTTNLLSILTMILSVSAMYVWCFYLTRAFWPSMVGSIIFVYNPYVFARWPDQMILYTLWPIPLAFLFFERSLKNPTNGNLLGFFFALAAELLSSLYYSTYLSIIFALYALARFRQTRKNPLLWWRWGTWVGAAVVGGVSLFTLFIYKYSLTGSVIARTSQEIEYFYAAWPVDWLFTSPAFVLWGPVGGWLANFFGSAVRSGSREEMSLFGGLTAAALFVASFRTVKTSTERAWWKVVLGLLLVSFILSLGPRIHLTLTTSLPNYLHELVTFLNPLVGYLRATARWAVFVFFFTGSIASLTWSQLEKRFGGMQKTIAGFFLCFLLILEYTKFPMDTMTVSTTTEAFYRDIREDRSIKTIVDLPIANDLPAKYPQSRMNFLDARYLLWATAYHRKNILNGYSGYVSTEVIGRGKILSVNFPTLEKLRTLRRWGVDAIVLHQDEFTDPEEFTRISAALGGLGVQEKNKVPGLALFTIMNIKP